MSDPERLARRQPGSDLGASLESLSPRLDDEAFVFVTLGDGDYGDGARLDPVATVREQEGLTMIVPEAKARAAGLNYNGVFRRITLEVHSDLEAVGLTAAVSRALAERGIAANVVAGFHHDHIFVPDERADEALAILRRSSCDPDSESALDETCDFPI